MSGETDSPSPAQSRRIKIAVGAGGIAIAGGAIFLAVFRGVTAFTLVDLPGILYVVGGAFLVHLLGAIIAGARAIARSFRKGKPKSEPWRYRALPAEGETVSAPLAGFTRAGVLLAALVALALIGVEALVVLPFDMPLSFRFFQAFLLVLITSTFASFVLAALMRIEVLVRWLLLRRRKISPEPT